MLAAVGRGELSSTDVMKAVFPDYKDERVTQAPKPREEGWFNLRNAAGMLFQIPGRAARKERQEQEGKSDALPIRGVRGDLPVRFAPEGAVPGDRIVGIMQPGSGITIYPIQSPSLTAFDDQPERWIDVRWDIDESTKERFPARVSVTAINAPGSLAEIAQVVAVQRRQHPYAVDGAHRARLHRNADRPRSLGLEAPQPTFVAIEGEFGGQRCAQGEWLTR